MSQESKINCALKSKLDKIFVIKKDHNHDSLGPNGGGENFIEMNTKR